MRRRNRSHSRACEAFAGEYIIAQAIALSILDHLVAGHAAVELRGLLCVPAQKLNPNPIAGVSHEILGITFAGFYHAKQCSFWIGEHRLLAPFGHFLRFGQYSPACLAYE